MYNTILLAVALQHWERYSGHAIAAREVAAALAKATSKPLHVLSAYDYEPIQVTGLAPDMVAKLREEQMQRTDRLMEDKLAEYVAPLRDDGIEVSTILRVGNPRDLIVQIATNIQADLLIIGSHSKRGLLDISLGGTAQQISRRAPCTVVLVSPKA